MLNKDRVEFDSAYDFIAVPKGDKNFIFDSFKKIGLNCYTNADNDIEGRKKIIYLNLLKMKFLFIVIKKKLVIIFY